MSAVLGRTHASTDDSDADACRNVLRELEETFECPFHYLPASLDQSASESVKPEELEVEISAFKKFCRRVKESRSPQVIRLVPQHSLRRQLLGAPIVCNGTLAGIAFQAFPETSDNLLCKLAQVCLDRVADRNEIARIRHENDSFVRQVTKDFEELVFLRAAAEQLDISSFQDGLVEIAEHVIPLMNESVRASWVGVYAKAARSHEWGLAFETNTTDVSSDVRRQIVEEYRHACLSQPIVRNVTQNAGLVAFPGVWNLILVPLAFEKQTRGWLLALNRQDGDRTDSADWQLGDDEFGTHEASLMATAASIMATQASNVELVREKEDVLVSVVRTLVAAIEAKDEYTRGHSERVALYGRCLAEQLGYTPDQAERLYLTGLLHDIGKIGISDATLKKPGRLTAEEFREIQRHPGEGWGILQGLKPLRYVLPGVLHHHERVDGGGYPDGLVSDQISLDARILAVADAYDAMTSDRSYRRGMPTAKAEAILRDGAGTQWDATVVGAFFDTIEQIYSIRENYRPLPRVQRNLEDQPADDCRSSM